MKKIKSSKLFIYTLFVVLSLASIYGIASAAFTPPPAGAPGTTDPTGTIVVANGGTGAITLSGVLIGNGTSAFTAIQPTLATAGNVLKVNSIGTAWISEAPTGGSSQWTTSGSNIYYDTGNVGIGTATPQTKLDVGGAIKVGTQVTCDFNTAGAIRYNSVEKKFEGCNGTNWGLIASVPPWACGDNVTFTYKGAQVTYGTVSNQGKCWMDRNLGASQVATAFNDSLAYGDLFQWGRLDDQHQTRTSGTTATLSSSDNPGHSNLIYNAGSPYDWRSPQNPNLWQGVSGTNNPCPSGWRIPTETELNTERLSWSSNNYNGAYASPLKLTAGGYRWYNNGSFINVGSNGIYWSSSVSGIDARSLDFYNADAIINSKVRASGYSVRCLKD